MSIESMKQFFQLPANARAIRRDMTIASPRKVPSRWAILTLEPVNPGGMEIRTRRLARALLDVGDEVCLIQFGCDTYVDVFRGYGERFKFVQPKEIDPWSFGVRSIWRSRRLISELGVDSMFLCQGTSLLYHAMLLGGKLAGVANVLVHHGGLPNESARAGQRTGIARGIRDAVAGKATRTPTHFLFNNPDQMAHWIRSVGYPAERCHLWMPPLDLTSDLVEESVKEAAPTLCETVVYGSAGRLVPQKAFGTLIRAFAIVHAAQPQSRLLIFGEGKDRVKLESLAAELSIAHAVSLPGAVNDISAHLGRIDVFVSSSEVESLGIAILEAMALQIPVVVTDLPGPRRVVENGRAGFIVPVNEPMAMAEAMLKMSSDELLRQRCTRNALEVVDQCRSERVVENLRALIAGSAGRGSSSAEFAEPPSEPNGAGEPNGG